MANGTCVSPPGCDDASGPVCGCDANSYTDECAAAAAGVVIASLGMCPNCAVDSNCLPGLVCSFSVGDCAMANGTCVEAPGCDAASGPVCGCNSNSFPDSCAARDAGVVVAALGACANPDSCTNGCGSNQYCRLPDGMCARFGFQSCGAVNVIEPMLAAAGVCTTKPTECPPDFDPVCVCEGNWLDTASNACEAARLGLNIVRPGICNYSCGGFGSLPCPDPLDICVQPCGVCGIFDAPGICDEDPGPCDDRCAPVCDCSGTWYRNRCESLQGAFHSNLHNEFAGGAGCGETFALQFTSKVEMHWGSVETGDDVYNVYRAPITGTGPPGPWDCVAPVLAQPPYSTGTPSAGEVWGYAVTQVANGVEGPLGYGGTSCSARIVSTFCPP